MRVTYINIVGVHLTPEELSIDGIEREVVGGVGRHHYSFSVIQVINN